MIPVGPARAMTGPTAPLETVEMVREKLGLVPAVQSASGVPTPSRASPSFTLRLVMR